MQIAELVHKVGKGIVNFLIFGGFFQVIFYNFFVCPGFGQRRRRKEVEKEKDKEARIFFLSSLLRLVHQSRHHLKRSKKKVGGYILVVRGQIPCAFSVKIQRALHFSHAYYYAELNVARVF